MTFEPGRNRVPSLALSALLGNMFYKFGRGYRRSTLRKRRLVRASRRKVLRFARSRLPARGRRFPRTYRRSRRSFRRVRFSRSKRVTYRSARTKYSAMTYKRWARKAPTFARRVLMLSWKKHTRRQNFEFGNTSYLQWYKPWMLSTGSVGTGFIFLWPSLNWSFAGANTDLESYMARYVTGYQNGLTLSAVQTVAAAGIDSAWDAVQVNTLGYPGENLTVRHSGPTDKYLHKWKRIDIVFQCMFSYRGKMHVGIAERKCFPEPRQSTAYLDQLTDFLPSHTTDFMDHSPPFNSRIFKKIAYKVLSFNQEPGAQNSIANADTLSTPNNRNVYPACEKRVSFFVKSNKMFSTPVRRVAAAPDDWNDVDNNTVPFLWFYPEYDLTYTSWSGPRAINGDEIGITSIQVTDVYYAPPGDPDDV